MTHGSVRRAGKVRRYTRCGRRPKALQRGLDGNRAMPAILSVFGVISLNGLAHEHPSVLQNPAGRTHVLHQHTTHRTFGC